MTNLKAAMKMTTALEMVGMGEVFAGDDGEFNCIGVGSGIVLAAYDSKSKVGACAHFILPSAPATFDRSRPGKYVNTGFAELIRKMQELGADASNIRVALAGGASLMSSTDASCFDLGNRNLEAAHEAMAELGMRCVAQDIGGQAGRTVSLSTKDGAVKVRTSVQPDRVLCNLRG
jgi:chemotaxis protein CheD